MLRAHFLRTARLLPIAILVLPLFAPAVPAQEGHDLQISLAANPSTTVSGMDVTVTMTVKNNGPLPAAEANVTSETPVGTTFVSVTSSSGTVDEQPPVGGTGAIAVSLGSLMVNQTQTVTLVLSVTAAPGSQVTVRGEVQPLFPSGDTNQSNNRGSTLIQVVAPTTADLGVTAEGEDPTAGHGSLFAYTVTVSNPATASPRDAAANVVLTSGTPEGTVFAAATASQGDVSAPPVGGTGVIACPVGALEAGSSATATFVVNVLAAAGSTLTFHVAVTSQATDPNPGNDAATVITPVVASNTVMLAWEAPAAPSDAVPKPPPQHFVVSEQAPAAAPAVPRVTLLGYNVYRSNTPGVAPAPGNLFAQLPPSQTGTSAPVAPGGSFFAVTAMYDTGESGPSNEGSADVPASTITKVKVKSTKITATGSGFTDEVQVLVDGIPFVSPAVLKKNGTRVQQKGNLLTGQSIGAYLAANPSVLLSFRNSNGGITTWRHTP